MMKYTLEVLGWSLEAMGFTLTDEQVKQVKSVMEHNGYDALSECRDYGDFEMEGIVDDIFDPDRFHIHRLLDHGNALYRVKDEEGEVILEFTQQELGSSQPHVDEPQKASRFSLESLSLLPEDMEDGENVLLIADELKGGFAAFPFESSGEVKAQDFCISEGVLKISSGDCAFVSKHFFLGNELQEWDAMDNEGKASTVALYSKSGSVIE